MDDIYGNAAQQLVDEHLWRKKWTKELEVPKHLKNRPNRVTPMFWAVKMAVMAMERGPRGTGS